MHVGNHTHVDNMPVHKGYQAMPLTTSVLSQFYRFHADVHAVVTACSMCR